MLQGRDKNLSASIHQWQCGAREDRSPGKDVRAGDATYEAKSPRREAGAEVRDRGYV
jgi:hypothetical protein